MTHHGSRSDVGLGVPQVRSYQPTRQGPSNPAPGGPGLPPTWSSSAKEAVGTSHYASRVWFTIGRGIVNEVYWPRVDRPQVRDLGFIVADGAGFWSEVKRRDVATDVRSVRPGIPAVVAVHRHPRYVLTLRICADDHADVVHIEARLKDTRDPSDPARVSASLRLYPLLAPHLGVSGLRNQAWQGTYKGHPMLLARSGSASLALACDPGPARQSVGFVGTSDGWQDFATNGCMAWSYDAAGPGNVAAMAELVPGDRPVHIALGFGDHDEAAALQVSAALVGHFEVAWQEYITNWQRFQATCTPPPADLDHALGELYLGSAAVLRSHQDRSAPGATVASLSIPWGNARNDLGGYHLVWSRDLVESAGALIALGARASAQRTLAYLVATQEPDGHWSQNQWVDGVAYWGGVQLDEAAYPILLAGALRRGGAMHMHGRHEEAAAFEHLVDEQALGRMIQAAAGFIARTGPATQQDRWEENAGLTTSTLAPVVAALVVAADHLPEPAATYCRELADDWNASIEDWTYATGSRLAREFGVDGHYVRIASPEVLSGAPLSTPIPVRNRPAPESLVPGDEMVGTDYLSLVRFGLRRPDDARILSTLTVCDALLAHGNAERDGVAPLQRRRLRRARGWPALRRHRDRPGLAAAGGGAGPLRAGGGPGPASVPRSDAPPSPRLVGCSRSRSGMRLISAMRAWSWVSPVAPRCRWRGLMRSTSSSCARWLWARPSTCPTRRGGATAAGARSRPGPRGVSRPRDRPCRPVDVCASSSWRRAGSATPSTTGARVSMSMPVIRASGCGSRMCPAPIDWSTGRSCRPRSTGRTSDAGKAGTCDLPSSQREGGHAES